jgi:hypothetical protein
MSVDARTGNIPEALRSLGAVRRLFEPSAASLGMSTARGLFPMLIGAGLFITAPRWIPAGGWKQIALCAVGALMFLNGLRVVLTAWWRSGQKVATFEHGFGVWRGRAPRIFRWEQVEAIDVTPEFFGFTVWCRDAQGRKQKIHFDSASDPTDQLRGLWRDLEEQTWRHRLPALQQAIGNGEEAVFVQKTWGKETGTKVVVSQYGLAVTPRFGRRTFVEWPAVESLEINGEHLVVRRKGEAGEWVREPMMAMPGSVAIVEAGGEARRVYLETLQLLAEPFKRVGRELAAQREVKFGRITLNLFGIAVDGAMVATWPMAMGARLDGDTLTIIKDEDDVDVDVGGLTFSDRLFLRMMPEWMRTAGG